MKISQREARQLRSRVRKLEDVLNQQRKAWSGDWPSSTVIARIQNPEAALFATVDTARKLKHAVVAVVQNNTIALFATELPSR